METENETLYMISQEALNPISRMPISKDEFDNIKKQIKILRAVTELQVRYEMILNNYMTLEKEFPSKEPYPMVLEYDLNIQDHDDLLEQRIRVHTLFLNLLTAVTCYCGYVKRTTIPELFNIEKHTKEMFSDKDYKFLIEIRNHLQHGGILHISMPHISRSGTKAEGYSLITSYYILLDLDLYVDNRKNRKNRKLEIPPIIEKKLDGDSQLSLHYVSRFCMDIHNSIHDEIMDLIKPTIQKARDYIENIRRNWEKHVKEQIPDNNAENIKTGLFAYAYTRKNNFISAENELIQALTTGPDSSSSHPDLNISDKIPLSLVWDDARKKLSEKNRRNLHLLKNKYEL